MVRLARGRIVACVKTRTTTNCCCWVNAIVLVAYRGSRRRSWKRRSNTCKSWIIALDNDYQQLRSELQRGLASAEHLSARQAARAAFSPGLSYGRHFGPPAPSVRQAAVIAMIEPRDGQWTLPVTVRP